MAAGRLKAWWCDRLAVYAEMDGDVETARVARGWAAACRGGETMGTVQHERPAGILRSGMRRYAAQCADLLARSARSRWVLAADAPGARPPVRDRCLGEARDGALLVACHLEAHPTAWHCDRSVGGWWMATPGGGLVWRPDEDGRLPEPRELPRAMR